MFDVKLGIQIYAVRDDFESDPEGTLKKIKEMGFDGVELTTASLTGAGWTFNSEGAKKCRDAFEKAELECYGLSTWYINFLPENIEKMINFNKAINSKSYTISYMPEEYIADLNAVDKTIDYMCDLTKMLSAENLITGFHNHEHDFFKLSNGKTFFEYVFDNTPEEFILLFDTGNAKATGVEPIDILKKYPTRVPLLHMKGYSQKDGNLAHMADDDINWHEFIKYAVENCNTEVFEVEFGQRGDYIPLEKAKTSLEFIKSILKKI